jgi:hypothetical protein
MKVSGKPRQCNAALCLLKCFREGKPTDFYLQHWYNLLCVCVCERERETERERK